MEKSISFLYSIDKQSEIEINNTTDTSIKNMKYLGINLSKEVKYLYTKNYKMFLKELKMT